jgi:hypothetical protein
MRRLGGQRMSPRLATRLASSCSATRIEAHRAGHGLAVGEAAVSRISAVGMLGRHLDMK